MNLRVKKVHRNAVIPQFAHVEDTGFDLFTCEPTEIAANSKAIVKTGLIFELPYGWGMQVRNKSGITIKGVPAYKKTMHINYDTQHIEYKHEPLPNGANITVFIGTIDQGYRGEVGIMIKNNENFNIVIPEGIKLAQGVLEKVYHCEFVEVEEVNTTERGIGGYGSTGLKEGK